ncbi:adenosylhomocysteinase [Nonomuraea longicatena]|uniref:adenosylhomocysteinase n=1 Tax=Nonomuraea longicatena TaxID=83682 RepID=UPI0031CE7993
MDGLARKVFGDPEQALAYVESRAAGQRLTLLDVGGYFAPVLEHLHARFSGELVGVVEDTENGHQRYIERFTGQGKKPPCPIFSVARSPLKDPEDYLVGQSVVFSTEALVRSRDDILNGRPACVIGYGKLGRSIAAMLHAKHVGVTVYDVDPVRRVQALSQGYRTAATLAEALSGAGIVVCATGNLALREDDFSRVSNGAYIASVTSSDDELELSALNGLYSRTAVEPNVTRYTRTGHYFYVLADGNAVNFLHGASVGAFILLVQAEIVAALALLATGSHDPDICELPPQSGSGLRLPG